MLCDVQHTAAPLYQLSKTLNILTNKPESERMEINGTSHLEALKNTKSFSLREATF